MKNKVNINIDFVEDFLGLNAYVVVRNTIPGKTFVDNGAWEFHADHTVETL